MLMTNFLPLDPVLIAVQKWCLEEIEKTMALLAFDPEDAAKYVRPVNVCLHEMTCL